MPLSGTYRLFAALTVACALFAQAPRRVIVDTDAGADDLLALLFLLQYKSVQIEAITIVHGLARPHEGAETVARLLAFTGHSEIPIFLGATRPLEGSAEFPSAWRDASDHLLRHLPPSSRRPSPALSFLKSRLLSGPPVDILALGPLTNFALALRDEPRLGKPIREFVWMGGAIQVPGNVPAAPTAEWNSYLDPLAVELLLATGWKLRVVGLDATNQVPITIADLERLEALRLTKSAWLAVELLRTEAASIAKGTYFAWDPLAAAILLHPPLVKTENAALDVRKRIPERGRLIRVPALKPNAVLCLSPKPAEFKRLYLSAMLQ